MAEYRSGDGFDRARNTAYQRKWRGAISRARKAKANRAAAAKKVKASRKKAKNYAKKWRPGRKKTNPNPFGPN